MKIAYLLCASALAANPFEDATANPERCHVTVGEDFNDGPLLYKTLEPYAAVDGFLERPPHLELYPHRGDVVEVISAPTDFITVGDPTHSWKYAQVRVLTGEAKGQVGWASMERDDDLFLFKPSEGCLYTLWQAPKSLKVTVNIHSRPIPPPANFHFHFLRLFVVCLLLVNLVRCCSSSASKQETTLLIFEDMDGDGLEEPLMTMVEV